MHCVRFVSQAKLGLSKWEKLMHKTKTTMRSRLHIVIHNRHPVSQSIAHAISENSSDLFDFSQLYLLYKQKAPTSEIGAPLIWKAPASVRCTSLSVFLFLKLSVADHVLILLSSDFGIWSMCYVSLLVLTHSSEGTFSRWYD